MNADVHHLAEPSATSSLWLNGGLFAGSRSVGGEEAALTAGSARAQLSVRPLCGGAD